MFSTRLRRHASQDVDVRRSYSIEDAGEARNYYIGLVGIILKFFMGTMFVLLFLAAQTAGIETQWIILLMFSIYVSGWMASRQAGLKDIATWQTILDVLAYGVFLGFAIQVTEGLVAQALTGVFELSQFGANTTIFADSMVMSAIALAVSSVAEELFYRGGLLPYMIAFLSNKYGLGESESKAIALLVQAGLFAVLHAAIYKQTQVIIALFVGGILFGLVFLWKKDLSVCMVAHLTLNLSRFLPSTGGFLVKNPILLLLALIATATVTCLILKNRGNQSEA